MKELKGKRVLVTGAAGFIGSHLVEELVARGAHVRAFVRYNSRGAAGWLDDLSAETRERIEVFPGDIRDRRRVREAFDDIEAAWHLAALIGIPYSYTAPVSYVQVNVEGTLNVLEAARETGTRKLVVTSTSEVYGTAVTVPMSEDHPLQAQSPYSATKIAADKLAESYARSFDLPVVIARPFNTFGPRQSPRAVIPTIVGQALSGAKVIRLGALHPTRDLNDVRDTVAGMIACADAPKEAHGTPINLGSGGELSIGDLAQRILERMNLSVPIESDASRVRPGASEVERLVADASRAKRLLGWEPVHDTNDALDWTIDWMRRNPRHVLHSDYRE